MKKYTAVLMSMLLLTFGFTIISEEIFASPPMKEKEKIPYGQMKKMEMIDLEGTLDMNFDGKDDAYLKIINPRKSNKSGR